MSYFDLSPIINKMLASGENVSSLHFNAGYPPQVKSKHFTRLLTVEIKGLRVLTTFQTEIISMFLLSDNNNATQRLIKTGSVETSFSFDEFNHFKVLIRLQNDKYSVGMFLIPEIEFLESLLVN